MAACLKGHALTAELLIAKGADMEAKDKASSRGSLYSLQIRVYVCRMICSVPVCMGGISIPVAVGVAIPELHDALTIRFV
jgi:hypothetical protein